MKIIVLFLFLFILSASLKAQNNQTQSDSTQTKQNRFIVEMTGQVGVTSDFRENVFLNLGGQG